MEESLLKKLLVSVAVITALSGFCMQDLRAENVVGSSPVRPSQANFSRESIIESGQRGGMLVPVGTNFTYEFNREMGEAMEVWNSRRWHEGNEMFKRIYKENPESPWAAEAELHVAACARLNGDYDESEERFLSVLVKHGHCDGLRQRVLLHLPQLYWETGRADAALASLNMIHDGNLSWTKRQFCENWSRIFFNAINLEEKDRRCGAVAVALALETISRSEVDTPLQNITMDELCKKYSWAMTESKHTDGYSLTELAAISGGKPRLIDFDTLRKKAKPGSPIVAYLEPPPAPKCFDRLNKQPPSGYKPPSGHFVVVENATDRIVTILDPRAGRIRYEVNRFIFLWTGKVLMLPGQDLQIGKAMPEKVAAASRGGCCGSPTPSTSLGGLDDTINNGKHQQDFCTDVKGAGARSRKKPGAPSYDFGLPNANLQVTDIPMWYPPARGPGMAIRLDHNRADSRNGADYTNVNYFCFGNKWSFNLASFMREAPSTNVTVTLPIGRHEEYYRLTNGAYVAKDARNKNLFAVAGEYGRLTFDIDNSAYSFWTNTEKLAKTEDRYGNAVTCLYDSATGWLTNVVDTAGRSFSFSYNQQGYVTNVTDILGRNSYFSYSNGNLVSMTDMGGYTTLLSYDTNNWVTNIVYPNNASVRFEYANGSQLGYPYKYYSYANYPAFRIRAIDSLNRTNEYFYHAFAALGPVTVRDQAGNSWLYGHDAHEPYTFITSDSVNENAYSGYTRRGDQWGRRIYDAAGVNLVEIHYATSACQNVIGYQSTGSYTTDHLSRYFTYDTNDWLTSETWKTNGATVGVWSNQYDTAGNLIWHQDALSNVTTVAYNSKNDPVAVTDALGNVTLIGYNSDGTLSALTNARGYVIRWQHDSKGFNTNIIFQDNTTNSMTYDSIGRMQTFKDAANSQLTFSYDNLDRITNVTFDSDSTRMAYSYSFAGLTKVTDRLGRETKIGRDAFGRVTAVTNALTNVVGFAYDSLDNISAICVGMGGYSNVTKFNYTSTNGLTRLTSRINPSGKTNNVYSYTFRGWLDKRTDGKGNETSYSHDALGRMTRVAYGGSANVDISYDVLGNVTKMVDQYGTNSFSYNAIGLPTNKTVNLSVPGFSSVAYKIDWRFDAVGNPTNVVLTGLSGFTNAISSIYTYDSMNRLTLASDPYASASYAYGSAGRLLTKTYGNGDVTKYGYDAESRLTSLVTTNSGNTVQSWYYGYNSMGMITNITNSLSTWSYNYDAIYRLTNEFYNGSDTFWAYDLAENRLTETCGTQTHYYSYSVDNELLARATATSDWIDVTGEVDPGPASNKWYYTLAFTGGKVGRVSTNDGTFCIEDVPVLVGTNQLSVTVQDVTGNTSNKTVTFMKQAVNGNLYSYDSNGNLVTNRSGSVTNLYYYDMENRLTQVTSNGVSLLQCWYDGMGRRIAKKEVVGGQTNRFMYVYDGWTVLAVLNGNGQLLEYYTRGIGLGGDIGTIVAERNLGNNTTYYYHSNHRGDVTCVRSGTTTVATYDYTAYGEKRSSSGSYSSRFRFSSKELDESTGFYYFGLRFYGPTIGRWTTQDPLKELGGLNQYVAFNNNPVNCQDPLGLEGFFEPVLNLGRVARGVGVGMAGKFLFDQWRLSHGGIEGLIGVTYFGTWTFYGRNYEGLSPAAQEIIEAHEARHRASLGEECARKGTIYDVDLLLSRGTYGELLGQGGRPLTPTEIQELNILKGQSQLWLQLHQMGWWQRTKEQLRYLVY